MTPSEELILLTDEDWSVIDQEPCRVLGFMPGGCIREGKIIVDKEGPYASVLLQCRKIRGTVKGYVTREIDFRHLWRVFRERILQENEEVIIFWTKEHHECEWLRPFRSLPTLTVMVCHRGWLEFMGDPSLKPESMSFEEMLRPIVYLKWAGMEKNGDEEAGE